MKQIYLDNAATTKVDEKVIASRPSFGWTFGLAITYVTSNRHLRFAQIPYISHESEFYATSPLFGNFWTFARKRAIGGPSCSSFGSRDM